LEYHYKDVFETPCTFFAAVIIFYNCHYYVTVENRIAFKCTIVTTEKNETVEWDENI
jgi:hypothetical protein